MAGKKKKGGDGEEGAPMWIVTFSDLMSLLLTFFVLLLSFSTITEEDFNDAMNSLQGAFGVMPMHSSFIAPVPRRPTKRSEEISKAARDLRRRMQVLGIERKVQIEYDALGGIKISLPSAVLFDAGNATLKAEAFSVLENVAEVLAELPDTFIEVHGHTDESPLSGRDGLFRDNYDLSYFRAHAVAARLLASAGIAPEQFEIIAHGPNMPLATNDSPEGRAANRRVELYVRGLVNKNKLEALRGLEDEPGMEPAPLELPIAPRELEGLR